MTKPSCAARVQRVRDDGFATNRSDWTEQRKIGALAVPVRHGERVLGSLNVVYRPPRSAPRRPWNALPRPLQEVAARIEAALAGRAAQACADDALTMR